MYKYKLRETRAKTPLIVIISGSENGIFLKDFMKAIITLEPLIISTEDVWVNDELLLEVKSNVGDFTISMDIWGFAFIMSESSWKVVFRIEILLRESNKFIRT